MLRSFIKMQNATMLNTVKPMVSTYKKTPIKNVVENLPNPQIPKISTPSDSVSITLSTNKIAFLIFGSCISIGWTILATIGGGLYLLDKKLDKKFDVINTKIDNELNTFDLKIENRLDSIRMFIWNKC